jgi:hypothetical protein
MEFIIREERLAVSGWSRHLCRDMKRPAWSSKSVKPITALSGHRLHLYLSQCSEKICFLSYMVDCQQRKDIGEAKSLFHVIELDGVLFLLWGLLFLDIVINDDFSWGLHLR